MSTCPAVQFVESSAKECTSITRIERENAVTTQEVTPSSLFSGPQPKSNQGPDSNSVSEPSLLSNFT